MLSQAQLFGAEGEENQAYGNLTEIADGAGGCFHGSSSCGQRPGGVPRWSWLDHRRDAGDCAGDEPFGNNFYSPVGCGERTGARKSSPHLYGGGGIAVRRTSNVGHGFCTAGIERG